MQIIRTSIVTILLCVVLPFAAVAQASEQAAVAALSGEIRRIDERMQGRFGAFVRHAGEGWEAGHGTDRPWYLASTVKIPLAVAVLQKVEAGELSLEQELQLTDADFVDGSGELLWHEPGDRFSIDELIGHSIRDSDSTATDMLIRLLGEEAFNRQIRERMVPEGFGPITTILQVRYDAYGEIHRDVQKLTNRDFIELKTESDPEARYRMVLQKLAIESDSVTVGSSAEAFERYYARGINSATLQAFGLLLERLVRGELLNELHTQKLLDRMETITTGDRRIKAGLPAGARFAQKTGTLIARCCNVGILNPHLPESAVVIAACAEGYDDLSQAEEAFEALGAALTRTGLVK